MKQDIEAVRSREAVLLQGQALSDDVRKTEALERYYAEAKDVEQLLYVVEDKLKRQRKLVQWWCDNVGKRGGDRRSKNQKPSTRFLKVKQAETAIDRKQQQISRWAEKCKDFDKTLADVQQRCVRTCEGEKTGTVRGTEGTGEFELYTPAIYIDAVREVLGEIDLDPASSIEAQRTVQATRFYTQGALQMVWGGRVFLNPPYHRELLPQFVSKLVEEVRSGSVTAAVLLTNNCTDTEWFATAHAACSAICFTTGRIKFLRPGGEHVLPTQGQAFFYFGADKGKFRKVFQQIGIGMQPYWQRRGE